MKASLRLREPSSFRNRSGMNFSGSFQYFSSMCAEYRLAMIIASLGMSKPWSLVSFSQHVVRKTLLKMEQYNRMGKEHIDLYLLKLWRLKDIQNISNRYLPFFGFPKVWPLDMAFFLCPLNQQVCFSQQPDKEN